MREIKSDKIFLKVEPSLKKAAQELAEENGKTLSGYICWLLEREAAEDNDTDSVKEEIRKIFTQYIKIKGNDVESHVNILISHIMVANLKLDPSMILAGSTAKKI